MPLGVDEPKLWTASIRREQFFDLLEMRGPRLAQNELLGLTRYTYLPEISGIWVGQNREALSPLPQVIVASEEQLKDLLAWTGSYLRELGPLSAISRICSSHQLATILNRDPPRDPWKFIGGAIGLIFGEIMALGELTSASAAFSARADSTLSYAIIRAWAIGLPSRSIAELIEKYRELPRAIRNSRVVELSDSIEAITAILLELDAFGGPYLSRNWFNELRSGADRYRLAGEIFHSDLLNRRSIEDLQDSTAEQRVKFFDTLAPSLVASVSHNERLDVSFALAFAAFLCRPGLEQQASLLGDYARELPEAWLWLGAFQNFSSLRESMTFGFGWGAHISQGLFRYDAIWTPPTADIGVTEIEVLRGTSSKILERLLNRSRLEVEIYPMISTTIRGATTYRQESDDSDARRLDDQVLLASKQLSAIEESIRVVRALLNANSKLPPKTSRKRR
jgi:hypothetical protein